MLSAKLRIALQPLTLAAPIYDNDRKVAVIIAQMSVERLDNAMTGSNGWEKEGLGKTGETYIVGEDFRMRNNSRFFIEDQKAYISQLKSEGSDEKLIQKIKENQTTILYQEVKTKASEDALQDICRYSDN